MIRATLERLLRLPPAPKPPPGDAADARVFRAAPKYFQYRLVVWFIVSGGLVLVAAVPLLALVGAAIADSEHRRGAGIALVFVAGFLALLVLARLLALAVLRFDYERRWYVVTDRSLRIREGVWIVRETTVTFANIQNLAVSQGPIQRALGLFDLRVETAGGGGGGGGKGAPGTSLHAAVFRGIDNAEEIKALIQERLRALKDSGLGDLDDHRATPHAPDAALLAALREVHAEAAALRAAAAR